MFVLQVDDERQEFGSGVKAVMAYVHAVTGGKPCALIDEGSLPEMPSVTIALYEGRVDAAIRGASDRAIAPAGYRAAWAFALGAISELGALDPLTQDDAHQFGMEYQRLPVAALPSAWHTWALVRRAERNEVHQ